MRQHLKKPLLSEVQRGDNEILLTALVMKQEGYDVIFISKDLNARVKADASALQQKIIQKNM